jgi:catechol 2,3-dioxygenase-like lactoylglutathione lyase family enzyme
VIAHIALVIKDYDEAIDFYVSKLDCVLLGNIKLNDEKRWGVVAPNGAKECSLLLGKPPTKSKPKVLETKQTDKFPYFFLPMIFS